MDKIKQWIFPWVKCCFVTSIFPLQISQIKSPLFLLWKGILLSWVLKFYSSGYISGFPGARARCHYVRAGINATTGAAGAGTTGGLKPRVATLSPSTSSGVMCAPWVRRSSSVTGLLCTWLLRDFSLFRTPPAAAAALRSRCGAAVLCTPPGTLSLAPLIVGPSRPTSDGRRPALNA